MIYLSDQQVERAILGNPLSTTNYMRYVRRRLAHTNVGADDAWAKVQKKIIYDDPLSKMGDIRPMTCFTDQVKIVKVIATNPTRYLNPHVSVGATLVLHQEENFPTHIIDATAMSGIRTAMVAHQVISWMYPRGASITLVGDGRVGGYFKQMYKDLDMGEGFLSVYDLSYGVPADYNVDVVVTATNSTKAFITDENCSADLVISLGADTRFNRELSHGFLRSREKIYVDITEAKRVGDLRNAKDLHSGYGDHGEIAELGVHGNLADLQRNKDANIFISVGSPLMDALTVEYILDRIKYVPSLAG